jgi:hypothetical protein
MSILFLNHSVQNCGVYQYGKRLNEILQKDNEIIYIYKEISSFEEYYNVIIQHNNVRAIIYNYHPSTMWWLNYMNIQRRVKNIGIPHECPEFLFEIICDLDPTILSSSNRFTLPRPLYENVDEIIAACPTTNENVNSFITSFTDTNIPIFGSFGFGFDNKGFDKIVKTINEQYDNAIIKFVIPVAHFDPDPNTIHKMRESCIHANQKPGIVLMISHDFFSDADLLRFLKSNTMNIFMYDEMHGRGISSTIDYALSVKRPIGISNSYMFRHIYNDNICLYKHSVSDCMDNSKYCIDKYTQLYSNENVRAVFKKMFSIL